MRILRISDVTNLTGLSRSSVYQLMSENKFPQSVALGGRSVGWVFTEVDEWIHMRIAERDASYASE